ncbi:hypothetical protein MCEVEH18_00831 [Candidatus Methylopumilus planktonicus]
MSKIKKVNMAEFKISNTIIADNYKSVVNAKIDIKNE